MFNGYVLALLPYTLTVLYFVAIHDNIITMIGVCIRCTTTG